MVQLKGLLICVPIYTMLALFAGAAFTFGIFMCHVAVVPLIFKFSKTFRRHLVFANHVHWPPNQNYDDPDSYRIKGARNLSIEYQSKVDNCTVKIGIWHILPRTVYKRLKETCETNMDKEELNRILDEELAYSKTPIMLYCHGNSCSRVERHRILLYKVFQKMEFHTIAFDYRGYGDSTNLRPTEAGVVEDALVVYDWLLSMLNSNSNVFVWGHSLGTAIASHLVGNLKELSESLLDRPTPLPLPRGLILEAPFNNLADEVAKHPLSRLVNWLPYFETMFVKPFRSNKEQTFKSDEYLARVTSLPVLILHARDDVIVPFVVGWRLYKSIQQSRTEGSAPVVMHAYDKQHKLGHKCICKASDLPQVIGTFVNQHAVR